MSLIERLKLESELKSTVSIGRLFQGFMTRSAKKLDLTELLQKYAIPSDDLSLVIADMYAIPS